MTSQPTDRPDGNGLSEPDRSMAAQALRHTVEEVNYGAASPTREGAEGAGDDCEQCNGSGRDTTRFNHDHLPCPQCQGTGKAAPPKPAPATMRERFNYDNEPAPDTMREALRDLIAQDRKCFQPCACLRNPQNGDCATFADRILICIEARKRGDAFGKFVQGQIADAEAAHSAPVPPADGDKRVKLSLVIEALESAANDARQKNISGFDALTGVAILLKRDSPSPTVAAEPVAWRWRNTAVTNRKWSYTESKMREHPSLTLEVQPLYASPLVRGDREAIKFGYTNYRGEASERHAVPISIRYGSSQYHKDEQWLMLARDLEKNEDREFAMRDMVLFNPPFTRLSLPVQSGAGERHG